LPVFSTFIQVWKKIEQGSARKNAKGKKRVFCKLVCTLLKLFSLLKKTLFAPIITLLVCFCRIFVLNFWQFVNNHSTTFRIENTFHSTSFSKNVKPCKSTLSIRNDALFFRRSEHKQQVFTTMSFSLTLVLLRAQAFLSTVVMMLDFRSHPSSDFHVHNARLTFCNFLFSSFKFIQMNGDWKNGLQNRGVEPKTSLAWVFYLTT